MELQLRISGIHYETLKGHLLPPDGKEAVAVALCGRYESETLTLLTVQDIILIPYEECISREDDHLKWPTARTIPYFEQLSKRDRALLKIHSHPNGYNNFSVADNISDREFFESAFGWSVSDRPHASVVMLPEGKMFGRFFFDDLHPEPIGKISVAGDEIQVHKSTASTGFDEFARRTVQTFGEGTYHTLRKLKVGVVGCSGTGSPLIEQLVRLGIGSIVLVDPDVVEEKNLNRILLTTSSDAQTKRPKVEAMAEAISRIGLGTSIESFQNNLYDEIYVLKSLIECDVVFGCMDSVDGRHLLNQLCTFYLVPYFDVGVKLEADGCGGISVICGSVHYLQPGQSSLISRGVYTNDDVRAASQYRKNPNEYENLRKNAYIKNVNVNSPAVISVNMHIASHAVNEFLNRMHPFKSEPARCYAQSTIDIVGGYVVNVSEEELQIDHYLRKRVGRGDVQPFIEMPELSDKENE